MNYRHAYHAGNYADVLKHALLVRLLRALQGKEKGLAYVDTHAGRGAYDLSLAAEGDTRARTPEWPQGIGMLWNARGLPAGLADYLDLVRAFDRSRGNLADEPRYYPGSPCLARLLARPQDRLVLWERHPAECSALRAEFERARRISVQLGDGYGAPRACLPPPEKRALVLIDPPFESPQEWSEVAGAVADSLARLPGGTVAVWYPLTARARVEGLLGVLRTHAVPTLAAEIIVAPQSQRMRGCGLAVLNPPWKFEAEARPVADYLAALFCPGFPESSSVRWIVPE